MRPANLSGQSKTLRPNGQLMSRPGPLWLSPVPALMLASGPPSWSPALSKEPGMFRRHRSRNGRITPEASLAEAQAARRQEERKHDAEKPVKARLDKIIEENDLAARFREALDNGKRK